MASDGQPRPRPLDSQFDMAPGGDAPARHRRRAATARPDGHGPPLSHQLIARLRLWEPAVRDDVVVAARARLSAGGRLSAAELADTVVERLVRERRR